MQPLGVHHAQVTHVALVGAQQPVVHQAGRLALEQHRGGVDGDHLVRVHCAVGAVRPQLGRVHEQAVGEAAPDAGRVPAAGLERQRQLGDTTVSENGLHPAGDTALRLTGLSPEILGDLPVSGLGIQLEWMLSQ